MLCCALWGGNAVAVKFAVPDFPPFGCAALRFVIALPLVAPRLPDAGQPLWVERRLWGCSCWSMRCSAVVADRHVQLGDEPQPGGAVVGLHQRPSACSSPRCRGCCSASGWGRGGWPGWGRRRWGSRSCCRPASGPEAAAVGDAVVLLSGAIFAVQTIAQKRTFPVIPPATLLFAQYVLATPIFFAYSLLIEGADAYRLDGDGALGRALPGGRRLGGLLLDLDGPAEALPGQPDGDPGVHDPAVRRRPRDG